MINFHPLVSTMTHFNYSRFSAAYGNIYTARQAAQMLQRALGRFKPVEDRWITAEALIIDAFRPGLRYPAMSDREFDLLTLQHLRNVLEAVRLAEVFIFTLGLTEAWISRRDGAVFPACPGTVAGAFDGSLHMFKNFTVSEVTHDLAELIDLLREINPKIRVILTVSPVPLVATATDEHVLRATTYSKSVLRVAAEDVARERSDVLYFPAYEIVTGPQAPYEFFKKDRREPSNSAIDAVMQIFLSQCESFNDISVIANGTSSELETCRNLDLDVATTRSDFSRQLSELVASAQCEEAAAGI